MRKDLPEAVVAVAGEVEEEEEEVVAEVVEEVVALEEEEVEVGASEEEEEVVDSEEEDIRCGSSKTSPLVFLLRDLLLLGLKSVSGATWRMLLCQWS